MLITEYSSRECCNESLDLKYFSGAKMTTDKHGQKIWINTDKPTVYYCVHCGRLWKSERYLDAAGDSDTRLVRMTARISMKKYVEASPKTIENTKHIWMKRHLHY